MDVMLFHLFTVFGKDDHARQFVIDVKFRLYRRASTVVKINLEALFRDQFDFYESIRPVVKFNLCQITIIVKFDVLTVPCTDNGALQYIISVYDFMYFSGFELAFVVVKHDLFGNACGYYDLFAEFGTSLIKCAFFIVSIYVLVRKYVARTIVCNMFTEYTRVIVSLSLRAYTRLWIEPID